MGHSILIYGSYIRGNSDKYSDKDLLIVADDFYELKRLKNIYVLQGWSVSTYTYSKLEYLSKNGFLFVKHLISEGIITEDSDHRLKVILEKFIEVKNYDDEIEKALNFIDFVKFVPNNKIGHLWLCDNIYVTLRNYLIYKSAKEKTFIFSYPDLINNLHKENVITLLEKKVLLDLRILKSSYRNDYLDIHPTEVYMSQILLIISKIGFKLNINFTDKEFELTEEIFNNISTSYKKLRFIELYLKSEDINDEYLTKCINNPQMYCNSKSIKKVLKKVLLNMRKSHSTLIKNTLYIPSNI